MFCAHCGAANDDNAYQCMSCGQVLERPGAPMAAAPQSSLGPAQPRLAQSIIVTLFCCQLCGIVAIVYSAIAMSKNSSGEFDAAHDAAKKANMWGWIGASFGIVVSILYLVLLVAGSAGMYTP